MKLLLKKDGSIDFENIALTIRYVGDGWHDKYVETLMAIEAHTRNRTIEEVAQLLAEDYGEYPRAVNIIRALKTTEETEQEFEDRTKEGFMEAMDKTLDRLGASDKGTKEDG